MAGGRLVEKGYCVPCTRAASVLPGGSVCRWERPQQSGRTFPACKCRRFTRQNPLGTKGPSFLRGNLQWELEGQRDSTGRPTNRPLPALPPPPASPFPVTGAPDFRLRNKQTQSLDSGKPARAFQGSRATNQRKEPPPPLRPAQLLIISEGKQPFLSSPPTPATPPPTPKTGFGFEDRQEAWFAAEMSRV